MGKITDTEKIEKIKTIFKEIGIDSMEAREPNSKEVHDEFMHESSFNDISDAIWKMACTLEKIANIVFEVRNETD